MRVKKHRATLRECKTCCFKNGIKCSIGSLREIKRFFGIKSCNSGYEVDWDKKSHPELFRQRQKNWQKMNRKEHVENVMKMIKLTTDLNEFFRKPYKKENVNE